MREARCYINTKDMPSLGACPLCGESLIRLHGDGWDWDHAVCPARGCLYDKALNEMTVYENGVYILTKKEKQ